MHLDERGNMKIEDIAKLANVSKSAVSLAINGKPGVSEATRKKILQIIEEHDYVPLRNTKSKQHTVRFIACTNQEGIDERFSDLPFFNELLATLTIESALESIDVIVSTLNTTNNISEQIANLEANRITDGMILLGTNLNEELIKQITQAYPNIVVIDTMYNTIDANFVSINNKLGAYQAMEYLIQNGHKNIAFAEGKQRLKNFTDRKKGALKACQDNEVVINQSSFVQFDGMSIQTNEQALENFATTNKWPTAIFCENDYIAISVIKTLNQYDKKVPEDISVIGFDNIGECSVINPELTTISVNKDQLIKNTLKLLKNNINNNENQKQQANINTKLIIRQSVKSIPIE